MDYRDLYIEKRVIGRGNFGTAVLVVRRGNGKEYVAKKTNISVMSSRDQQLAKQEAEVLSRIRHPYIVGFEESFVHNGLLVIIMEYCSRGDLSLLVKALKGRNEYLEQECICLWLVQIVTAVLHLHSIKILHRDIKSSNIYLTAEGVIKLGDLGIVKVLDHTQDVASTIVGTPYYMSPEICQNSPYTYQSDIWSLGVVLYELCALSHPFAATSILGLIVKITQEEPPPIPAHFSQEIVEALKLMLMKDAKKRASLQRVLSIPIFKQQLENLPRPDAETPSQQLRRRKLEAANRNAERMAQAAKHSYILGHESLLRNRDVQMSGRTTEAFSSSLIQDVESEEEEIKNSSILLPYEYEDPLKGELSRINPMELVETQYPLLQLSVNTCVDLEYSTTNDNTLFGPLLDQRVSEDEEYSEDEDFYSDDFESDTEEEKIFENPLISQLRAKAIGTLGIDCYNQLYSLLKEARKNSTSDDITRNLVREQLGYSIAEQLFVVDQILYFESKL